MKEITIVFQTNNIKTKFTIRRDKAMQLYISILVSGMTLRKFHGPRCSLFVRCCGHASALLIDKKHAYCERSIWLLY
jgi:hypothetical protein